MDTLQTYERLLPIIADIDKSITCQSVSAVTGGYKFLCKYTKWAVAGFSLTIGLVTYKITEVVCNESITVSGASLPTQLTFDLYAPKFKHGTIKKVAGELNKLLAPTDRTPLIYLQETVDEGLNFDQSSMIDVNADCRLYFLTAANFKDWTQIEGDTLATRPMRNLVREFIEALTRHRSIGEMTNVGNIKNYNLIGGQDANGTISNMFNEPMNGVQLRVTIPFIKECFCCDIPQLDLRPAPGYVYNSLGDLLAVLYSNEIYVSLGGTVNIIDQNDNIINTVEAPGDYQVTVLTEIRDTIDANTATIIDNLI